MDARTSPARLLVAIASLALLGGCAGATKTPGSASPAASSTTVPSASAPTRTPEPTPTVVVTYDIPYESSNRVFEPAKLDIYAPVRDGTSPVVVMIPAGDKRMYQEHARRVADQGFVVFVPNWGIGMTGAPGYDELVATGTEAACAVEFARAGAGQYRGDPGKLILFGHSAGASTASIVAFARPGPSAGCAVNGSLGKVDALVTWDGEWLAQTTFMGWDELIAADPRVFDALSPWTDLPAHWDLRVVMLSEAHPNADFNYERPLPDKATMDAFFAPRDPSGVLRAQLEANGALADGVLDALEAQQLLFSILKAQGNPVTLDLMPDTNHTTIGAAGWPVFLKAFEKAAGRA